MHFFVSLHHYSAALFLQRLCVGLIFWAHGMMKAPMRKMQPSEQLPASALRNLKMLSVAEPLGAIAIAIGLLTQLTAFCFVLVMIGAIGYKRKTRMPFMAKGSAGGWEFELLLLVSSLSIVLMGPGRISLDHLLFGI
jgi:putative oxidoreductase